VIVLSDEFYNETLAHPIPTDVDAIKVLASAPAVLDLFMWLVYRCFVAKREEKIPLFGDFGLTAQLGSVEYTRPRRFRAMVQQWLSTIRTVWPECPAKISREGRYLSVAPAKAIHERPEPGGRDQTKAAKARATGTVVLNSTTRSHRDIEDPVVGERYRVQQRRDIAAGLEAARGFPVPVLAAVTALEGDAVERAAVINGLPDGCHDPANIDGCDGALLWLLALHLLESCDGGCRRRVLTRRPAAVRPRVSG